MCIRDSYNISCSIVAGDRGGKRGQSVDRRYLLTWEESKRSRPNFIEPDWFREEKERWRNDILTGFSHAYVVEIRVD